MVDQTATKVWPRYESNLFKMYEGKICGVFIRIREHGERGDCMRQTGSIPYATTMLICRG